MYISIQGKNGEEIVHRNMHACPKVFRKTIRPYNEDIVVAVECRCSGTVTVLCLTNGGLIGVM